jgi:hypothetical protein
MDTLSSGTKFPPPGSGVDSSPLLSSGTCSDFLKGYSEIDSGDVKRDSDPDVLPFRFPPESVFTSPRNRYSPFPGTLIHIDRIPHLQNSRAAPS